MRVERKDSGFPMKKTLLLMLQHTAIQHGARYGLMCYVGIYRKIGDSPKWVGEIMGIPKFEGSWCYLNGGRKLAQDV